MMTPPEFCASSSAIADLPLAVGPAAIIIFGSMEFVVTLLAGPEKALTQVLADDMARAIGAQGAQWIEEGVACDLLLPAEAGIQDTLDVRLRERDIDYIIQPLAHRRKK